MDADATRKVAEYCRAESALLALQAKQAKERAEPSRRRRFCLDVLSSELSRSGSECAVARGEEDIFVVRKRTRSAREVKAEEVEACLSDLESLGRERLLSSSTIVDAVVDAVSAPFFVEREGGASLSTSPPPGCVPHELSPEMSAYALAAKAAADAVSAASERFSAEKKKASAAKKAVRKDVFLAMKTTTRPLSVRVKGGGGEGSGGGGEYRIRYASSARPDPFRARHLTQLVKRITAEWIDQNNLSEDASDSSLSSLVSEEYKASLLSRVLGEMDRKDGAVRSVEAVKLMAVADPSSPPPAGRPAVTPLP